MDFKLSELELRIIVILNNSPTMSELAKRTGVTVGYISRLITSLQHKEPLLCCYACRPTP
ncbi:MAG TPA: hypothetical protein VMW53_04450 [archaeon]|nr:hypothetical protein [archaeon]